jgi:hypothetical protein
MEPHDIEELRSLTDALAVEEERFADFPALQKLVRLAGELAHESREPVATTVVNGGPDLRPLHAFVVRVAGAAGMIRALPKEDGDALPQVVKSGLQEIGYALQLLEAGQ